MTDSQWQRHAAQRAWLASTRGVGRWVGAGLFVLSALRLVMMVPWLSSGFGGVIVRSPFIGETIGGGLIAIGWFVILGKQPRRDQRVLGIVGMLASVALALSGAKSIAAEDLFAAFTAQTTVWLEIAVTATALVGASMWGGARTPTTTPLAWVGIAMMMFTAALEGPRVFELGPLWYVLVPAATWAFAGGSALTMRALRPDLPPGVPSAILVRR